MSHSPNRLQALTSTKNMTPEALAEWAWKLRTERARRQMLGSRSSASRLPEHASSATPRTAEPAN